jgi:hypothetical protein
MPNGSLPNIHCVVPSVRTSAEMALVFLYGSNSIKGSPRKIPQTIVNIFED